MKVYIYELPEKFNHRPDELTIVSETYLFLLDFFERHRTNNPKEADLFLVPINLIQFQFAGKNPRRITKYLVHRNLCKPHLIIALGDFSQRSSIVNFGHVYKRPYKWLDDFNLLALESTSDLIKNVDVAIFPTNCFVQAGSTMYSDLAARRYLWSFLGTTQHQLLPSTHIRNRVTRALTFEHYEEGFVGEQLDKNLRDELEFSKSVSDDYELMARNSTFTISPAGYGSWTYRFYQAIQWGSIPVLLCDDFTPPFSSHIPWDKLIIRIPESDYLDVRDILLRVSKSQIESFNLNFHKYRELFTEQNFEIMLKKELSRISSPS